jgi:N-methylhydantoinase B
MSARIDPVTLEVVRNALPAVANEMAVDLQRTSYNMMIYEIRDFCTAVVGADGRLISQNVGGVSHFISDLGVIVEDGVTRYGKDGFAPGDVIITNHQRVAGQHLNNIVIYTPFFAEGELICFPMVRAHWTDVGGASTGYGGGPKVSDPWVEGLQLDQLKIYEAGEVNAVLHKVICDNIRFPESSMGDLRAQIASCHLATRRLDDLYRKHGVETMSSAIEQIFDETEAKCRNWVMRVPDGIYEAESSLDDDGLGNGEPVPVHAKVTVKGSDMTIDLSGCSGERKAGINSRTYAAAYVAYKALTAPLEPVNEGSFRAVDVVIPEGNIMMARYPAPMSSWSMPIPCVIDTILAALASAVPDQVPAAHKGCMGGGLVFYGKRPDDGKPFMLQSTEGAGWGGRPTEDGESGAVNVCQGDVRNGTIEGIEHKCPVLFEKRALLPNSGGAGKFRGGLGLEIRVRNLVEGRWNLRATFRVKCPPWGLWGGKPGRTAGKYLQLPGENDFKMVDVSGYLTPPESEVMILTSGGGGWGDPLERDPMRVRLDVTEGLVSPDNARDEYGVVLTGDDFILDETGTEALRAQIKSECGDVQVPTVVTRSTAA